MSDDPEEMDENFRWLEQDREPQRQWVSSCWCETLLFLRKFDCSYDDSFWSFRMAPVKECQYLTDRTSVRGGIPIAMADNGDGGLENVYVFSYTLIIYVFRYICVHISIFLTDQYTLLYFFFSLDFHTEVFDVVYIGSLFFCPLHFVFLSAGGSAWGESQPFKSEATCPQHSVFVVSVLMLELNSRSTASPL